MSVLINFKICDNAKECSGIKICPTQALFWDEKNKTIGIDNAKCASCGLCEDSCMVDAIKVAKTEEEYQAIKKEIDDDSRKVTDLLVDRYGANSIIPAFFIPETKFDLEILQSNKLTILEIYDDNSIMCLLSSIPIKSLFGNMDIKYRKMKLEENSSFEYETEQLPALLFFRSGKLIGKVEGFYGSEKKKELKEQIDKIII